MNPKKHEITPVGQEKSNKLSKWQEKLQKFQKKPAVRKAPFLSSKKYLYLLLDVSGSMEGDDLLFAKRGAKEFVDIATKKGYHVGLISFGSDAELKIPACRNIYDIKVSIDRLSIDGSTNMTDALNIGTQELTKKKGTRVLWVVTDGYPDEERTALESGRVAKKTGIDIICLGTETANHNFLQKLASRKTLAKETTSKNLSLAMKTIAEELPENGNILRENQYCKAFEIRKEGDDNDLF